MLRHPVEHRAEIFEVDEQQTAFVSDAEHDVQHTVLCLVELHQTREQLRSHLRDGGAHGVTLFAEDVIETYRTSLELWVRNLEFGEALLDEATHLSYLRDTAEVTFHVGHEAGNACLAEGLCHDLQGDSFSCTCGTGDESMSVCHLTCNAECAVSAMGNVKSSFLVVHKIYSLNFLQR